MISTVCGWINRPSWSDANLKGAAVTLLATLLLLVALEMLAKAFERLRKFSLTRIEASKAAKQIQQTAPEATTGLERSVGYAVGLVHVIVAIVLIDIYVTLVLRLFPATEELSGQYFEFVITPIIALWRSFTGYLPNAIEIIVLSLLTLLNCPVGNTLIHY